jgi:hypothetical protein
MASSRKSMLLATSGRNTGCTYIVLSCVVLSCLILSCLVFFLLCVVLPLSSLVIIFVIVVAIAIQMPLWFVSTRIREPRSRASKAIRFLGLVIVVSCSVLSCPVLSCLLSESCLCLSLPCLCQSSSGALDVVGEIHPFLGERNVSHMDPCLCVFWSCLVSCIVFVLCLSVYVYLSLSLAIVVIVVFVFLLFFEVCSLVLFCPRSPM